MGKFSTISTVLKLKQRVFSIILSKGKEKKEFCFTVSPVHLQDSQNEI